MGKLQAPGGSTPGEALWPGSGKTTSPMRQCRGASPAGDCGSRSPGPLGAQGGHPPARNGLDQARLAELLSVGAEMTAARAARGASSSGPEGGAAASTRAALYPGEEASWRRPVTPGPAGPYGLQPRHSLAPLQYPLLRLTCRGPPQIAPNSERNSDLRLPRPDNNKRPTGPAPLL